MLESNLSSLIQFTVSYSAAAFDCSSSCFDALFDEKPALFYGEYSQIDVRVQSLKSFGRFAIARESFFFIFFIFYLKFIFTESWRSVL